MDLLVALARVIVDAPLPFLGVVWWLSARWAKAKRIPMWWLGVPVALTWLYKNKRSLRGAITWVGGAVLALVWCALLVSSPRFRFAVGVALPTGAVAAGLTYLGSNYPTLPPTLALRAALADYRHRELIVDATNGSAPGARVVSTKVLPGGDVEAIIIGPPGVSHADLLGSLRDTLAESVLATSGRRMRNVAVVGAGARGEALVRCSTVDRYAETVRLEDLA